MTGIGFGDVLYPRPFPVGETHDLGLESLGGGIAVAALYAQISPFLAPSQTLDVRGRRLPKRVGEETEEDVIM